jgi:hypothetical protein
MSEDDDTTDPLLAAVLRRLRSLREEHEPDGERLWARVDPGRTPPAPAASPAGARRRPALVVGLAAVSAVAVVVGTQTLGDPGDDASRSAQGIPTISAPIAPAAEPASGATAPDPVETASERPPPPARTREPARQPPPVADPGITLATSPGELLVETPDELDWVVAGGREDGRVVRAKRPVGGAALTVTPRGATQVTPSGGVLSWEDGTPEENRTTTTWAVANGGWTVTVTPATTTRLLVIHAGATGPLTVRANTRAETFRSPPPRAEVRVRLPAGSTETRVTLTSSSPIAVSAASLRG